MASASCMHETCGGAAVRVTAPRLASAALTVVVAASVAIGVPGPHFLVAFVWIAVTPVFWIKWWRFWGQMVGIALLWLYFLAFLDGAVRPGMCCGTFVGVILMVPFSVTFVWVLSLPIQALAAIVRRVRDESEAGTTTPHGSASQSTRRGFRWPVCTLALLVPLGWGSFKTFQALRPRPPHQAELLAIGRLGAEILYRGAGPAAPAVRIDLCRPSGCSDAALSYLGEIEELESLDMASAPITDAGLMHLRRLTRLSKLTLCDTDVTDAGLEHVKPLKSLRSLDLRRTKVTDEGVSGLQRSLPARSSGSGAGSRTRRHRV